MGIISGHKTPNVRLPFLAQEITVLQATNKFPVAGGATWRRTPWSQTLQLLLHVSK